MRRPDLCGDVGCSFVRRFPPSHPIGPVRFGCVRGTHHFPLLCTRWVKVERVCWMALSARCRGDVGDRLRSLDTETRETRVSGIQKTRGLFIGPG